MASSEMVMLKERLGKIVAQRVGLAWPEATASFCRKKMVIFLTPVTPVTYPVLQLIKA